MGLVMNTNIKNLIFTSLFLGLSSVSFNILAQDDDVHSGYEFEEIVVSAPFDDREAETALPITVLAGEELLEKASNSLGETLKDQIGVNNASFGPGVGQPIIRGQTARRVMSLTNSVGVTDAAALSPDHVNAVEAILAERIEVIRGPATLLYGNGAIGGVVNVIDNRIPETLVDEPQFIIQQTRDTVNDEDKTIIRFDASAGNFGFHLDAFRRESDNVEIKGFAIDEVNVERLEELVAEHIGEDHHDEEHDEEEGHEEEFENTNGFIGNSNSESDGGTLGFSWVGDNGFIGFSVNDISSDYGIPPGSHAHHEEEGHEEDEEEGHEEDEHGHEEVEFVRIDMDSQRYDIRGGLELSDSFIESIRGSLGFTDYEHSEVEFFEDGGSEVGTLFSNEGTEARFTLTHRPVGNWTGVWGFQLSDTEFSAIGEEAYIPRSDITSRGIFGVERYTEGNITAEIGLRFEDNSVSPNGRCERDISASSISGSVLYDLNEDSNFLIGLSRSERAPAVEELYSNTSATTCAPQADDEDFVAHAATGLFEIGNPNLNEETANNIEFGYRLHSGPVTGQFSAYVNEIDDYIYLNLTAEQHEGTGIANWIARDAEFRGVEAEVAFNLVENSNGSLQLRLFGDMVDAEFDNGGNVPRIPAAKIGAELHWFASNWSVHVHLTDVDEQDDAAELELPTDGYTNVSLYADYHWNFGDDSELKLFVRGNNLLDEEIRNHASFLKNFAPEPGRGFMLGLRLDY